MQKAPQLYVVSANLRGSILEDLKLRKAPSVGQFEPEILKQAFERGEPQMGSQRFSPQGIFLEFIFPDPQKGTVILTVFCPTEERIVYLPVPKWVVENVWQGDVSGSYHFESHAQELLAAFEGLLSPEANAALFEQQTDFVRR
jgi:hypothetical protein